jgi:beta-aspartyl-peptidase (threonine type)
VTPSEVNDWLSRPTLPAIVVHGGAWVKDTEVEPDVIEGVAQAVQLGFALLEAGASALDAVEAAVAALEENPHFNAGLGACLTSAGTIELDASIMEGTTLDAGAVSSVAGIRNPVKLARQVMTRSGHLLLSGAGAHGFAQEIGGIELVPDDWHITPTQRARFDELVREQANGATPDRRKLGTVGAAAVDLQGHVAAATSTGGTVFKRPGRVGDTPIIGAGTYADNTSAAVSCTGHGESFIKLTTARSTSDLVQSGLSPLEAAERSTRLLRDRLGGDGGLIIVAPDGRAGWAMNTPRMSRAFLRRGLSKPIALV